jgi:hypothetical protein
VVQYRRPKEKSYTIVEKLLKKFRMANQKLVYFISMEFLTEQYKLDERLTSFVDSIDDFGPLRRPTL